MMAATMAPITPAAPATATLAEAAPVLEGLGEEEPELV